MDISSELKRRFCQDCCIPIDIYTEPIFQSRIQLFDRFYNTIERYNIFLKMLQERYTTYDLESSVTVTSVRKGTCEIEAHSSSDPLTFDKCNIIVKDDTDTDVVQSVTIDMTQMFIAVGAKRNIVAKVEPQTVSNRKIEWSTSDKRVATVRGGVVVGIGKGECVITAISDKDKTKTAECTVKVTDEVKVESLNFVYHDTQIEVGHQEKLSVNSLPLEATDPDLVWQSSNTHVATVDSKGIVTAISVGSCSITVSSKTDSKLTDVCYVLVQNFVKVSGIVFDKYDLDVIVGSTLKLEYEVLPEKATNKQVRWRSTNSSIAKINTDTGVIDAIGRGDVTIQAYSVADPSRTAECILHVVPSLHVRSIEIDKHEHTMDIETSVDLSCIVSVGYDVCPKILWSSTNERIATVDSSKSELTLKSTKVHAQDYYNDYDEVKCNLVKQIKYSSGYSRFNAVNVDSTWPISCTCLKSSIYTPDMDGHTMISVSINKPLFTPLYHYDPTIFKSMSAWENFVSTVGQTDNDHIIYSENLLKEVMACCNQSRIEAYGEYILNNFYIGKVKPLVDALGKDTDGTAFATMIHFSKSEFVIDVTKLSKVIDLDPSTALLYTNRMIKLYHDISYRTAGYTCPHTESPNHQPFPMTVRLFTLYKIKTEHEEGEGDDATTIISGNNIDGYVKNIYYEGNQPLEFIDNDPCQLPMLMRTMSYESLQDNDRKFMHRGMIAQFTDDYKIHVPPITSIPDTPKPDSTTC